MEKANIDHDFKKTYSDLNLAGENGEWLPLHNSCPFCDSCWKHIQSRKPANNGFYTITRPWVGENYNNLKLLVIAINMNEYGGYEGAIKLMNTAKAEIDRGKIKMFVKKSYPGTFLFHRMGCYATAFVEKENLIMPTWKGHCPLPKDIVSSLDYISYTNHIKCSPIGEKSQPSVQMWRNCGKFILKKEIEILQPNKILILGNSDNYVYLKQNVFDEMTSLAFKGKIGICNGLFKNREIEITVVPHPASRGGNELKIIDDLRNVLNNGC